MASADMTTDSLTVVDVVPNPNVQRDGLKAYGGLLRKYGFNPTKPGPFTTEAVIGPLAQVDMQIAGNRVIGGKGKLRRKLVYKDKNGRIGMVPANSVSNDLEWLCPIKIGTPAKTYNMNFDTGSSDLWLWSTELPSTYNTAGRNLYDKKKSRSFNLTKDATWKITYNDESSAGGIVGTDIVNLGGLKLKPQTIQLANTISPSFLQIPGDGILGLGFGFINHVTPTPVSTPPETLATQKNYPVEKQIFTAYLSSYKDAADRDHKSFYTFGFIDKKSLHGQEIHYTDVDNSQGLWQYQSTTATIGDRPVVRFDNTAVADTGTTLALIDDSICGAIYDQIPGSRYEPSVQGYIFPANTTLDALPLVKFAFGDKEFAVQKEDMTYASVGNGYVYGAFQSRGDLSFDVCGGTILKSSYIVFDFGKSRIGVVKRPDSTQQPPSSVIRSLESLPENPASSSSLLEARAKGSSSGGSSATSLGIRTFSSPSSSSLMYASFILLATMLFPKGSMRFILAGWLCLVLVLC